jgi:outer membrane biosynthesis protein TonB
VHIDGSIGGAPELEPEGGGAPTPSPSPSPSPSSAPAPAPVPEQSEPIDNTAGGGEQRRRALQSAGSHEFAVVRTLAQQMQAASANGGAIVLNDTAHLMSALTQSSGCAESSTGCASTMAVLEATAITLSGINQYAADSLGNASASNANILDIGNNIRWLVDGTVVQQVKQLDLDMREGTRPVAELTLSADTLAVQFSLTAVGTLVEFSRAQGLVGTLDRIVLPEPEPEPQMQPEPEPERNSQVQPEPEPEPEPEFDIQVRAALQLADRSYIGLPPSNYPVAWAVCMAYRSYRQWLQVASDLSSRGSAIASSGASSPVGLLVALAGAVALSGFGVVMLLRERRTRRTHLKSHLFLQQIWQ